uniref:CSON009212 protein n=1 Tax=Culicoides sonorensis TaxID=179676 RepID=A0A336MXA5_CULSO
MSAYTDTGCDFVAGCFGGACGVLIGHPFDTIKTWQQKLNATVGASFVHILNRPEGRGNLRSLNTGDPLKTLAQFKGFYRGMSFPLIANGGINSVIYSVYGSHLRTLESNLTDKEKLRDRNKNVFLAGMVAGFIQAYLVCPIELLKIRSQTRAFYGSTLSYAKHIFASEGLNGFYRGITPTLYRDVLPYGIYMATYDVFLDMVENCMDIHKRDSIFKSSYSGIIAVSGSIAGVLSWLFVVPFDVVKTKMQAETNPKIHPTMLATAVEVFKTGGARALIRGTKMILLRSMPVNAFTFLGYEHCLSACHYIVDQMNMKPSQLVANS